MVFVHFHHHHKYCNLPLNCNEFPFKQVAYCKSAKLTKPASDSPKRRKLRESVRAVETRRNYSKTPKSCAIKQMVNASANSYGSFVLSNIPRASITQERTECRLPFVK